jgi:nitrite reductase/ring-hydroxylating ferredoxin subunit
MASDAVAATKTTKPTPTPKKKKPSPTPTAKKPTPSKSATPSPSPSKITEGIVIAKSSELAIRQIKVFFIKDSFGISTGYSLTRTSRGVVMAFDSKCTHAGVPTSVSGSQLKCPAHGSIFNPENGEVIRGPAVEPLKSYRTIEADGEIRIVIS